MTDDERDYEEERWQREQHRAEMEDQAMTTPVTYQQIRDSKPGSVFVSESGEYWYQERIILELDVAGIDYSTPACDWVQFYTYDGPLGDSDTVYGR